MSRGRRSRTWLSAALCAAVVMGLVSAASEPALAADLSEAGEEAFADIAACASTGDNLLAQIVVDSSKSLKQTDPQDRRVGAVLTALDSLEQLQLAAGDTLDVRVSLSTFARGYSPLVGWGSLSGTHAEKLKTTVSQELPGKDGSSGTNYAEALGGARASLNREAAKLEGSSCKVVFWFTDGKLDIGAKTDGVRKQLCNPQGIVDSVRGDNISVIALALFAGNGVTVQDKERLRATAEGSGSGESCGTVPIGDSASGGAYLPADDALAMRRLFAQAAAMIDGATLGTTVVCPGAACVNGVLSLPVDAGIKGFRLILDRGSSADASTLTSPSGESASLNPALKDIDGSTVLVSDRNGLMSVSAEVTGDAAGTWTLKTNPKSTTIVDLYYDWGVTLQVESKAGLYVGEESALRIAPIDDDGKPVDLSVLKSSVLDLKIEGAEIISEVADESGWDVTIDIPATDVPPALLIDASVRATTDPHELSLGPITARTELETRLPPAFPSVAPTRLELPEIVGTDSSTGTLTFTGSDKGDTRACVTPSKAHAPSAAGSVTLAAAAEKCIDIPQGAVVEMPIEASAQRPADGRVDGELTVSLAEANGDEKIDVSVPYELSMSRPIDQPMLLWVTALLVILALAIAWSVAAASRWFGERYSFSAYARYASVPVMASESGVTRPDAAELFSASDDFHPMGFARQTRKGALSASGIDYRRRLPWNPLAEAQPYVSAGDSIVVVPGGKDLVMDPDARRAPVRFPGSLGFVFVAESAVGDEDVPVRGRIVMIVDAPDGVSSVLEERIAEVHDAPWDRIVATVTKARAVRQESVAVALKQGSQPTGASSSATADDDPEPSGPPGMDWDDDSPSSGPSFPTTSSKRGKSSRNRTDSKTSDTSNDDSPPPSPNFWD